MGLSVPSLSGCFCTDFKPFQGAFGIILGLCPTAGWVSHYTTTQRISRYTNTYTTYTTTYKASHSLTPTSHIRASLQRVIGLDGWWLLLLYKSILLCGKYTIYSMHLAPPACKRGLYPPCVTRIRVLHIYTYYTYTRITRIHMYTYLGHYARWGGVFSCIQLQERGAPWALAFSGGRRCIQKILPYLQLSCYCWQWWWLYEGVEIGLMGGGGCKFSLMWEYICPSIINDFLFVVQILMALCPDKAPRLSIKVVIGIWPPYELGDDTAI